MINTEAKSLQRDLNKLNTRLSKLSQTQERTIRKLISTHEASLRRARSESARLNAAERKQLEAQKADLTKRLNLVVGRAGK